MRNVFLWDERSKQGSMNIALQLWKNAEALGEGSERVCTNHTEGSETSDAHRPIAEQGIKAGRGERKGRRERKRVG